ncbi:hypothetical protein DLM45_05550 [Hyphomicrobium methylovorum]|jgi:hypothetical protein|nr:hypothetical protein [Hyphomicrobium methylovorum]
MYWAFHIYWTLMSIGALYATYVRLKYQGHGHAQAFIVLLVAAAYLLIEYGPVWPYFMYVAAIAAYLASYLFVLLGKYTEYSVWLIGFFWPHLIILALVSADLGHFTPYLCFLMGALVLWLTLSDIFNILTEKIPHNRTTIILHYTYFLINLLFLIIVFAKLHSYFGVLIGGSFTSHNFFDALYFSVVVWTTLGFGDIVPASSAGRITVMIEASLGLMSMALAVAVTLSVIGKLSINEPPNDQGDS